MTRESFEAAAGDAPLMDAARATDASDVAAVSRLRKRWGAGEVSAALELCEGSRRLAGKWPELHKQLFSDRAGAEMASSQLAATHKAQRLMSLGEPVLDLCCGIGADALAMGSVEASDIDPARVWMCEQNLKLVGDGVARVADAENETINGRIVHLDPQRRSKKGRSWRYEDIEPGPAFVERVAQESRAACIKLGPGVSADEIPDGQLEILSESGQLTQTLLWTGELAGATSRATLLRRGKQSLSIEGVAADPAHAPRADGAFIHAIDPAPERAGLLPALCGELGMGMLHPRVGLLASDAPSESAWLTSFELIERMPWRRDRVRAALRAHDTGIVEVKTRGKACDPDVEQKYLRGKGGRRLTVFVLRFGEKIEALICSRR